jgi:hypothetical protein
MGTLLAWLRLSDARALDWYVSDCETVEFSSIHRWQFFGRLSALNLSCVEQQTDQLLEIKRN